MKKHWSNELQEISRAYLDINGTHIKSLNHDFGIVHIDKANSIYHIELLIVGTNS